MQDRAGHDRRYASDCGKIEHELGYKAATSLQQGLAATFAWYLSHEDWWRRVLDGSYRRLDQPDHRAPQ